MWIPRPVKSFWSSTGRVAPIRSCVCPGGAAGSTVRTRRKRSSIPSRLLTRTCPDEVIAGALNRNGLLTGRGNRWTQERVSALRSHHAIPCYDADKCEAEGWMNLTEAANSLGVNARILRLAVERGESTSRASLARRPLDF